MVVRAPELLQERGEILRLGDDVRRPQQTLEVDVREPTVVDPAEEVPDVEHAGDVVERLAVHRIARVRRVEDNREHLLGGLVDRDRGDVGLRHHHVGDVLVPEDEDLVDHLALALLDLSLLGRAGDEHAQLGLGMHLALGAGRLEPERVEDRVARLLQEPDRGAEDREKRAHGNRDPERRPLCVPERRALRHELSEDDVEEAQDRVRDEDREDRRHPVLELARQRLLAESTDAQGGERDAELHRGDEPARIAGDAQDVPRAAVPLVLELDDPRPASRDEAVLRRHEERVEQDQDRNPDQLEEKCHALTRRARVLGGFSSNSPAGV
jgi:hypothetical protein